MELDAPESISILIPSMGNWIKGNFGFVDKEFKSISAYLFARHLLENFDLY